MTENLEGKFEQVTDFVMKFWIELAVLIIFIYFWVF